jgi:hypothetical protein
MQTAGKEESELLNNNLIAANLKIEEAGKY